MLDFRIHTFLTLCETKSYTKAAEALNMTQPAVTQHIKFLEANFGAKLFFYSGKALKITEKGKLLRTYANSMSYNEKYLKNKMKEKYTDNILNIGATKTIGEYVISDKIKTYLKSGKNLNLYVDNTQALLKRLENGKLDLAIAEGFFDKSKYSFKLMKKEKLVGICAKDHPFAGSWADMEQILNNNLIVREEGSGTRDIAEQMLIRNGYTLSAFEGVTQISNFSVIADLVASNFGISFVYETVYLKNKERLSKFSVNNESLCGEFNFVYLKDIVITDEIKRFIQLAAI